MVAISAGAAQAEDAGRFPQFRHVDKGAIQPSAPLPPSLTLLADEDFAPFSFKAADGTMTGIAVQLGLNACAELRLQCVVKPMPYAGLLQALNEKQGDVVLGGPQASGKTAATALATRPYYLSYSQFAMRTGTSFTGVDARALAGRRLGFVKGSGQEAFLKAYYDRANLVPFPAEDAVLEALRTGGLDLAFVDSTRLAFWLKGSASRGCCVAFGAAFTDKAHFTHALVMMTRPQDTALHDALDMALDRLQEKGISAKVFAAFLPSSPF